MKKMMKYLLALAAVLVMVNARPVEVKAEETPADIIAEYVHRVHSGEYEALYEESFNVIKHMNTQEDYTNALKELYGGLTGLQYKVLADSADTKEFALYSNNKRIANLRGVKNGEQWFYSTIFNTMETYIIEVEHDKEVLANGSPLGSDLMLNSNVEAANHAGLGYTKSDLLVDQYRLMNMINVPVITAEEEDTTITDVVNGTVYVGEDLTDDEELAAMILQYVEICAMYPAQDSSLGAVASVCLQDSEFYSRISEVQNFWFTAHSAPTISNEKVLKIVKQSDDAIIANVIFDYYCTNGAVSRTWNCGYQVSLINVDGVWRIGGMGTDSTLNPNSKYYKN